MSVLVCLIATEKVLDRYGFLRVTTVEELSASNFLLVCPTGSINVIVRYPLGEAKVKPNEKLLSENEKSLSEGTIDL